MICSMVKKREAISIETIYDKDPKKDGGRGLRH